MVMIDVWNRQYHDVQSPELLHRRVNCGLHVRLLSNVCPDRVYFGIWVLPLDDLRGPLGGLYVDINKEDTCTFLYEQNARFKANPTEKRDEPLR